ncbi:MAG: hypothetical protein WBG51_17830, partial [Syntrophobacteria bacterium]
AQGRQAPRDPSTPSINSGQEAQGKLARDRQDRQAQDGESRSHRIVDRLLLTFCRSLLATGFFGC